MGKGAAAMLPPPPAKHSVGDRVMALYADGQNYAATIARAGDSQTYTVDWDDGDERCREREEGQVFALADGDPEAMTEGGSGAAGAAAAPARRRGRNATSAGAAPPLAETAAESVNRKRKLEQLALARENMPRKKPAPTPSLHNGLSATGLNPTGKVQAAKEGEDLTVVGRERQMESMLNFGKKCVSAGKGGSMYISGAPGVGKTLTMHTMQRLLKGWQLKVGKTSRIVMINAMQLNDPEHIFHIAWKAIYPKAGDPPPRSQVRAKLEQRLKHSWVEENHTTFLVVDEIDGLLSGNCSVLYKLFEWPHLPGSRLAVMGIANSIDLTERTLPYLKQKNIVPERLHFHTYEQEDLKRILQWRMDQPSKPAQSAAAARATRASSAR